MSERVLLVTGGSRGIGEAAARRAAAAGYRVALLSRNAETLAPLADELDGIAVAADVGNWGSLQPAVAEVVDRFSRIDAVFANAGIMVGGSFFDPSEPEQWREMVLTNVYGAAITARATLPYLSETKGHLVLTGSVAGRHVRRASLYSATKWAVSGLAASIREEAAGTDVRITVIQPGIVDTELITPEMREKPKLEPDDIARAVLFALDQPTSVDVNEIVVRPTGQEK